MGCFGNQENIYTFTKRTLKSAYVPGIKCKKTGWGRRLSLTKLRATVLEGFRV